MEFPIPSGGLSEWIASGPDGTVWFTEGDGNRIGKITPNGVITEFATAVGSLPEGITIGPDGNLWFTEYSRNKIGTGKINPCQGSGIPCITSPASGVSPQSQFVVLTGTGTAHDLLNVLANGNPVGGGPVVVDSGETGKPLLMLPRSGIPLQFKFRIQLASILRTRSPFIR